jgi:RNase P subunit RPR2
VEQNDRKFLAAPAQGESKDNACKRCGSLIELTTSLPRRLDSPAYEIFRCACCGFVDWVAQDVS